MTDEEYNKIKQEEKHLLIEDNQNELIKLYLLEKVGKEEYKIQSIFTKQKFRLICRRDKGNRRRGIENKLSFILLSDDNTTLCRIDTAGKDHTNPDGSSVSTPHIHIYQESSETRFAYPLDEIDDFIGCDSEASMLLQFLKYFTVINVDSVEYNANFA